ncbi:hypothetical protein D3C87_587970 [compost metagenome]
MAFEYKRETIHVDNDNQIEPIANKYAGLGWRLHSVIPIAMSYGATVRINLVFEREILMDNDSGPR